MTSAGRWPNPDRMPAKPALLALHPYAAKALLPLEDVFEVISGETEANLDAALAEHGPRIVGIVAVGGEPIGEALIARAPNLKQIVAMGSGYDGIDVAAARARGVTVTSAAMDLPDDVADHAVALLLGARKRLIEYDRWARDGSWLQRTQQPMHSISTDRIGIVGMGPIGQAIARKIEPFCPQIAWWGPNPKLGLRWERRASILELAEWCSVLVLAARGDATTRGLIDAETIAAIGPTGLFVNVARGFMVDEDALIAALRAGALGQAALDVFETEPTDPERWRDVPNVVLTPHVGGYTFERIGAAALVLHANLRGILTGQAPRNVVA